MSKGYIQIVVLALIRKDNSYLFTLRNDGDSKMNGKWQIPGGGLEFGETPIQTLHREVKEELGTRVVLLHSDPLIDTETRGNWQGIFIAYICELQNYSAEIILNEEATEYRWFTFSELKELELLPGCIELVEKVELLKTEI